MLIDDMMHACMMQHSGGIRSLPQQLCAIIGRTVASMGDGRVDTKAQPIGVNRWRHEL